DGLLPLVVGHPDERPFRLLLEVPGKARVYENTKALPEAYIVHSVVPADSGEEAKEILASSRFNEQETAELECSDPPLKPTPCNSLASLRELDRLKVTRPDCNTVRIKCKVSREGMLVLTDTFYPGWKAYMIKSYGTSEELPIYRANYLFRAVKV